MGASSVREIDFLSRIAEPTIGYITNYGKAHLEGFGSEQGIIQGKSELYDFLRETGGLSVVNADDAMQMKKSAHMNRITFGSSKADFVIKKLDNSEDEFLHVLFNKKIIKSQLTGAYNFPNIFAAITIGKYLGMTDEDVALGISQYVPQNNRSEIRQIKTNTVILDAYNANPTSVEMALRALAARKGYKVAILGDMFELGRFALEEHYRMLSLARELGINRIITVGELYMEVFSGRGVEQYITTQECMDGLSLGKPLRKATILIKGSRGMRLEQLLDFLNT
jgi:UDP-N-acetylmuramoyl-tripeptide--D-alanyl-D-alanine ligase